MCRIDTVHYQEVSNAKGEWSAVYPSFRGTRKMPHDHRMVLDSNHNHHHSEVGIPHEEQPFNKHVEFDIETLGYSIIYHHEGGDDNNDINQ